MGCHSSQTIHSQLITILGNLAASLSNGLSWTVQLISATVQFISGTVQFISGTVQFISGTVQLVSGTFKRKRKSDQHILPIYSGLAHTPPPGPPRAPGPGSARLAPARRRPAPPLRGPVPGQSGLGADPHPGRHHRRRHPRLSSRRFCPRLRRHRPGRVRLSGVCRADALVGGHRRHRRHRPGLRRGHDGG